MSQTALQADPKKIERLLEEDRRVIEDSRARRAGHVRAAKRAERAIRETRRVLRRTRYRP